MIGTESVNTQASARPSGIDAAWGRLVESRRFVWITSLVYFGVYCVVTGPILSGDSMTYAKWADVLIADRFDLGQYLARGLGGSVAPLYVGMVTTVALVKLMTPHWAVVMLLLNIVALASIAASLVMLCRLLTRSRIAAWTAFAFCFLSYEFFYWGRYVLSDMIFAALSLQVFLAALAIARGEAFASRRIVGTAALIVVSVFFRPTGVLLVPMLGFAFLFRFTRVSRVAIAAIVAITLFFGSVATLSMSAYWSYRPDRFPFAKMGDMVRLKAKRDATGEVISQRPELFHEPAQTYADFLLIMATRFVRFFQFTNRTFSPIHNLIGILSFVPLYVLAVFGVRSSFSSGDAGYIAAATLACAYIWTTAAFHAVTFLDYDWRYRMPIFPVAFLLAAIGASMLLRAARNRN